MEYRDMSSAEHGSGLHMAEKTGCLSGKRPYEWRQSCPDGSRYGVFPGDYETEEEYLSALIDAEESF